MVYRYEDRAVCVVAVAGGSQICRSSDCDYERRYNNLFALFCKDQPRHTVNGTPASILVQKGQTDKRVEFCTSAYSTQTTTRQRAEIHIGGAWISPIITHMMLARACMARYYIELQFG